MASADTIFKEFREHSVAEFFRKNRQMLGFAGKTRSLTTIVHEYVTNSLDACEEGGILPDISVKIESANNGDHCIVRVEDNGPGIPPKLVGKALGMMLAGTKFHRYMQQRGQQGIGASGCTMFAQITTGKPVHIRTGTGTGKVYECDLAVDLKTNRPLPANEKTVDGDFKGLIVEGEFGEVKYDKGEYGVFEYIKRTALANPHAQISFSGPDGDSAIFPRASSVVPQKGQEVLPHPLGITTHELIDMAHHSEDRKLTSFLTNNFARVSAAKIDELRTVMPNFDIDKKPAALTWPEAEEMTKAFQQMKWIAPSTDALRPIGKEQIEKALVNILNPEFMVVGDRKPKVFRGGVPFMVEAAVAYGGNAGRRTAEGAVGGSIIRYANRAPLLFDAGGCAISEACNSIDWNRYDMRDFDVMPITIFVNFVSVHVPYTGAGKQAISDEEEILDEIKRSVMECCRDVQLHLRGKARVGEREAKKKAIMRYVEQLARDLADLSGKGSAEQIQKKLVALVEGKYQKHIEEASLEEIAGEAAAVEHAANGENGNGEE
ncbi:MAG: DNA topoisomerase VI subunit B [Candidatus Burarchaeum sp.]|nr:DNA topoisomerase VI subunit B [Candidatus Burarchaeum sp.]MDO8339521.1 DNA topoisomerase VI subunit B [Candidatus Burarchaeum sp.]